MNSRSLADHQLEEPDKKERAQRHVEKGGLEADRKGQAGKGQQKDDAHRGRQSPSGCRPGSARRQSRRRRDQRQQRAHNADKERNQHRARDQERAQAPANAPIGWAKRRDSVRCDSCYEESTLRCRFTASTARAANVPLRHTIPQPRARGGAWHATYRFNSAALWAGTKVGLSVSACWMRRPRPLDPPASPGTATPVVNLLDARRDRVHLVGQRHHILGPPQPGRPQRAQTGTTTCARADQARAPGREAAAASPNSSAPPGLTPG